MFGTVDGGLLEGDTSYVSPVNATWHFLDQKVQALRACAPKCNTRHVTPPLRLSES
jgi:hypothetical protein